MVPDRQKVWTDGQTHGRRQNYIPPTSSGDKKGHYSLIIIPHPDPHALAANDMRMRENDVTLGIPKSSFSEILFFFLYILLDPLSSIIGRCTLYTPGCRMKAYKYTISKLPYRVL